MAKYITRQELNQLGLDNKVKYIDIRGKDEHAYEHIPESVCIPLGDLAAKKHFLAAYADQPVVFYCQTGTRTKQSEALFEELGITEVYILQNGLTGWKQAKGETHKPAKATLPIMRQVQMVVGFMVLLGAFLGFFVSPGLVWISAFFGAGLLFAGITGNCGLAKLLGLLPYNRGKRS